MKKYLIIYLIFSIFLFGITAEEILEKVDYNMTPSSIKYDGEMIIHKKNKKFVKKMKIQAVGKNLAFIEFISPPRDKGTKYLRNGDNLWIFLPKADRTVKISGHMLRQNMMGSDISYEDQTDRTHLTDIYNSEILKETEGLYTLRLVAKEGEDTAYYMRVIEVDKENYVLKNSKMYAMSGKLLKEFYVDEIIRIKGRYYITKFRMEDKIKKGSYTELLLSDIVIDPDISDSVFTLRNLERRN
ncbi:outer membrane lipoprotein-sorting protein [Ilyobacter polytropus]|uniref:Sigma E regulatory protein, MucB/RseB n=1 Tax=Ilyobacter polytropus (strain ATCC 51220 / DSM 2926 / LMG 16218 / CuHBu1) TaxID=572544 RepID=E3H8N9_ILYPC|nr:outer membrane lipoprotein-sorting protein [Ilyobacter polytropus]ADO83021.1 putative sigma E regulatory protein, MucB/RseB [Ilyobacter polytropus DSM 2926]